MKFYVWLKQDPDRPSGLKAKFALYFLHAECIGENRKMKPHAGFWLVMANCRSFHLVQKREKKNKKNCKQFLQSATSSKKRPETFKITEN